MASEIKPEELASEILSTMKEYVKVTEEAAWQGIEMTAKEAVQKLRNAHPAGSGEYRTWDRYNKGWTIMKTKRDKKATVHNATSYQLTHLLENGHALRQGGRAKAFPHILPVAERAEKDLLDNIKRNI